MFTFDINNIRIEYVRLKSCTLAFGGAISIVSGQKNGKDIYKRIRIPQPIVRSFIKTYNIRQYFNPVPVALVYYKDGVIALERHPLSSEENRSNIIGNWVCDSKRNIERIIKPLTQTGKWYTDGTFVYSFPNDPSVTAEPLSHDQRFNAVEVDAVKLANLHTSSLLYPSTRTCIMYKTSNGQTALTSPIWKKINSIGSSRIDEDDDEENQQGVEQFQFDKIDEHLAVNLSFALKAASEISKHFGYDAIEPLRLDELMIELNTVNLPSIPKELKYTYDIGLNFTHAMAWLIGLSSQTKTFECMLSLRSLMKYLTTKGVYRRNTFNEQSVFINKEQKDVPLLTIEKAAAKASNNLDTIIRINELFRNRKNNDHDMTTVGSLYDAS